MLLYKAGALQVQIILGTFLYYSRAIDPCILPVLNEIASKQSKPTTDTATKCDMLMDYLHTNPNAVIRYRDREILLKFVSNTVFLLLPQARSRAAAVYHLVWNDKNKQNGLVDVLCQTIKNVVASASEAETGGIYLSAIHCLPIQIACIELVHPQPPNGTPFKTNNSTAHGFLTSNVRSNPYKSFDMRYWWIKDRIKQEMFDLI